jgi:hypothetical protein
VEDIIIRIELQLNINQSENMNVRGTRTARRTTSVRTTYSMTTQLHIPLGNATQPGTPGVGSNATPPMGARATKPAKSTQDSKLQEQAIEE